MPPKSSPLATSTVQRATRLRHAICEACLDLVQEGVLQPRADQVADRAGVSRRSVFNHFRDLAALYDAVVEAGMQRYAALLEEIPREGSATERAERLVRARASFFEATAPFARALTAQMLVGSARDQARRVARQALQRQHAVVERLFADEIVLLAPGARAAMREALAAAVSQPTWDQLRHIRGLSVPRARAAVLRMLLALLRDAGAPIEGAAGKDGSAGSRARPLASPAQPDS